MATTHPRATGDPLPRRLLLIIGTGAAAIFLLLAVGAIVGTDTSSIPTTQKITATPMRPTSDDLAARAGVSLRSDSPLKDDRFIALIKSGAIRGGYPVGNPDDMIAAAHAVCAMVGAGQSVTDASSKVQAGYRFTARQAQALGALAVDVYCPENRP